MNKKNLSIQARIAVIIKELSEINAQLERKINPFPKRLIDTPYGSYTEQELEKVKTNI